ncbi:MAG: D-glucuronyl C5-epimerase family protein [Pseudaminobacter sp.]
MLVAALGIAALFSIAFLAKSTEHWPIFSKPTDLTDLVTKQTSGWIKNPGTVAKYRKHDPVGPYLQPSDPSPCRTNERRPVDEDGTPWFVDKVGQHRHPLSAAQCGLSAYNWMIAGGDGAEIVQANADLLISLQDESGAFRYPFAWKHHLLDDAWQPGWASAMAQGEGLSLLVRAWHITKDEKYLVAGRKALDYLLTPVANGGVTTTLTDIDPSLHRYRFYEEYPTQPASYTLNGFMFTLFGLYDWSKAAPVEFGQQEAELAFSEGVKTLSRILPYYDLGNITAYDLGYITHPDARVLARASYHVIHVRQLDLLFRLTGIKTFQKFSRVWEQYVSNPARH